MLMNGVNNYLKEMARVLRPGGYMWNTYLLLDEVSEPLVEKVKKTGTVLPHSVPGGRTAWKDNPEHLSGQYLSLVTSSHAAHNISVKEIRYGPWSGRTENLKAGYQDVIIAQKTPS